MSIAAVVVALAWALSPTRAPMEPRSDWSGSKSESLDTGGADRRHPAVDASVFQVRLWNAPVDPESATVRKEEPSAPANVDLIAIIAEPDRFVAAIYDATADRLHMVSAGDHIGRFEIKQVDARGVELRDGSRVFRLTLTPSPAEPNTRLTLWQSEEFQP